MGDRVRIIDGPFIDFGGTIERIDAAGTIKVVVMFFGRGTGVELQRRQVEPLNA